MCKPNLETIKESMELKYQAHSNLMQCLDATLWASVCWLESEFLPTVNGLAFLKTAILEGRNVG
jgi:hypothetical protein